MDVLSGDIGKVKQPPTRRQVENRDASLVLNEAVEHVHHSDNSRHEVKGMMMMMMMKLM